MKHFSFALVMTVGAMLSACQSAPAPAPAPYHTPELYFKEADTLFVSAGRASCNSSKPMQCLMVRRADGHDFGIAYDAIIGFSPANNVNYTIRARPEFDKKTEQATGRWILDEILSQTPVASH